MLVRSARTNVISVLCSEAHHCAKLHSSVLQFSICRKCICTPARTWRQSLHAPMQASRDTPDASGGLYQQIVKVQTSPQNGVDAPLDGDAVHVSAYYPGARRSSDLSAELSVSAHDVHSPVYHVCGAVIAVAMHHLRLHDPPHA